MADDTANSETVKVTIDGQVVDARPGEMIIAAAERNGVYIPRFCYHPRMRPVGVCRMCLVEVKGPRGFSLQPSCFIPVADGQEVVTDSDKVKKAQDGVLEFLLVNHPLDCPVCDKGGECPLQDQTLAYGPGESRFVEEKRHFEKPIALSDLVLIDRERCIQCDRCTRFADEVAGDPLIEFIGRGDHIEVNTFPDLPFSSYFSGNTVQICPVGALLAKPYRFKARPWDLEQVESTCTVCSVGCRIAVQSSGGTLTRYLGVDSEPVNHGWLCDKGRFSYEAVNSADRLAAPLVKKDGELVEVSWSEALEAAAKGIRDVVSLHGAGSVAVLGGARLADQDAYAWARLAKAVIGTDNVDAQMGDGLAAEVVLGLPRATIDEACAAPVVVLLAPDLKEELPVLYLRLRAAAVEGRTKLIEISPQATGLTRYCASSLRYRPGEASVLAGALAGASDGDVAGVGAAAIAEARALLSDGAVVVLGRPSVAESAESIEGAASALASGLPGARFLPALRRGNVMGALEMGLAPGLLPGRVTLDDGAEWFRAGWGAVPGERGRDATELLVSAAEGRMQAVVLVGSDPLSDFPDREQARRSLAGAGFLVAVDTFLNDSARQADVVLPAAAFAERAGTTTNIEGRVTRLGQKVTPAGVSWPDWVIASELAHQLGTDFGWTSLDDIDGEIARLAPSRRGLSSAAVAGDGQRDGLVAPATSHHSGLADPVDPTATPGLVEVETQGQPDVAAGDDGPDDVAPTVDAPETPSPTAVSIGVRPPAPLTYQPAAVSGAVPALDGYSLRLVSSRHLYDGGVTAQHAPALAGLSRPLRLRANPYDLDRLGVTTGGRVRVISPRSSMVVEVEADTGIPRGSASLPFNLPGTGAADLIDGSGPVTDVRIENV